MKISKERAHNAAIKIAAPMMEQIKAHDAKINEDVRAMYLSKVPKKVQELFKECPDYFRTDGGAYLGKLKGSNVWAYFDPVIPETANPIITSKETEAITKLLNTKETLREKYDAAVLSFESTILGLGTEKKVETEFPEAYPFIGAAPTVTAVAINIQPVRKLAYALIPDCGNKKK